jgi:transcriptional regulator with XRE-family HTH domain
MKPSIHKQLIDGLAPYKGQHARIARDLGLAQATISRVSTGKGSPTLAVAQPILDWLAGKQKTKKTIIRVLPAPTGLGKKPKQQDANGRSLGNLKPARASHG